MVKKISNVLHQQNSIFGASLILVITLFLSNVLGVVRDHYLTQKIPTDLLSSYYAAFRIPDLIFNVLILGAIASAFIPVFTTLITQKKNQEAWLVAASVINIAIIFLVLSSLILVVIIPYLMPFIVPGFDVAHRELTVKLARIMLASPILFGLSYIFGGILNSFKRFFVYSLAPLVYNLTIITGTLLFASKYSVTGVAVAVVCGAFLHFLIQLPVAIKLGFRWHFKIALHHWGVKRIGLLMFPRAIALGSNQIMLLVFTAIASAIGGYAIAVYTLADNIQTMPTVVFGTSFATAIFPTLAESASSGKDSNFGNHVGRMIRIILFFMVPMTIMIYLLRAEIVRLILGSGFFGWEQTIATANALGFFALSLVFSGLIPLFSRSFYALHNTKIPMIITVIGVLVSVTLAKIFANKLGVGGLALAFSAGSFITASILYFILRKKIKLENEKEIAIFILKIILAGVLAAIAIQESKMIIGLFVNMQRSWGVAIKTLVSLGAGTLVYLLCCWIFGCEEIRSIKLIFLKFGGHPINESGKEESIQ
jgi:putative peptidoglycan lipid II flippase